MLVQPVIDEIHVPGRTSGIGVQALTMSYDADTLLPIMDRDVARRQRAR